jgi:hypothetical protein
MTTIGPGLGWDVVELGCETINPPVWRIDAGDYSKFSTKLSVANAQVSFKSARQPQSPTNLTRNCMQVSLRTVILDP